MNLIIRKVDKIFPIDYHACVARLLRKNDMNLITEKFLCFCECVSYFDHAAKSGQFEMRSSYVIFGFFVERVFHRCVG